MISPLWRILNTSNGELFARRLVFSLVIHKQWLFFSLFREIEGYNDRRSLPLEYLYVDIYI